MNFLAIDIGNTNIVVGIFSGGALKTHWRIATRKRSTADEYGIVLKDLFRVAGLDEGEISGAAMSCVVPSLEGVLKLALTSYFGITPVVVGPGTKTGMPIRTENPREVGADRIVNAVGAFDMYRGAVIVVDFGTAVTFDYISAEGAYSGGAIAPGISISTDALFQRAAKLPRVDISRPASVVGRSTLESLKAGIFYGSVSMVDGIVERMRKEVGTKPKVVATGGMATLIADECKTIDYVDEFLTLKGLKLIYEVNS